MNKEVDGYGRRPVSERMAKLCPFRKKIFRRVKLDPNEWEEEFLECLQEDCAAWRDGGCGLVLVNPAINPVIVDGKTNSAETAGQPADSDGKEDNKKQELLEAKIKVLEARETKTPGTVRAWCQFAENGRKEAVFAKNGAGRVLLESVDKEVNVKYRRMNDGTAFAVFVKAES